MRRAAACLVILLAGCREPARELSHGPAGEAASRALVESLALRFGPARRDAALQSVRAKLGRAALVPSRIFDDATAWPERDGERRTFEIVGQGSLPGPYHLAVRRPADAPSAPGDYRGRVQLRKTGSGRYQWDVTEELAVGPVRVADMAAALEALFRGAEETDGIEARAAVRRAFPRASASLGRLVRLETLAAWREGGGTRLQVGLRLVPESIAATAPRLSDFVRRYFGPMRLHAVASDPSAREWWALDASQGRWTLQLRLREGSLVPLRGAADARIPESLRVTVDYETRMGRFRVGVRQLLVELTLVRTPAEKGFVLRFAREPSWQLPFLVEPLLHGPLQHPFEAPSSEAGYWAREQPGGPTRLVRSFRVRVRESFILRWLGGLTSVAMSDFLAGAEEELDAWSRECLLAVRDDLDALDR
jgi:hypothetical protein